jgi:hypothetical protein
MYLCLYYTTTHVVNTNMLISCGRIQLLAEARFGLAGLIGNDESLFKDQSRDNNCYGTARTTTT